MFMRIHTKAFSISSGIVISMMMLVVLLILKKCDMNFSLIKNVYAVIMIPLAGFLMGSIVSGCIAMIYNQLFVRMK